MAIRAAITSGEGIPDTPEDDEQHVPEGATLYRMHRTRERSPRLRQRKLTQMLRSRGRLVCEACDVHLPAVYGDAAHDLVEVHHVVSLSVSGPVDVRLADLAVLCPNCHRMIHRLVSTTPAQLRDLITATAGGDGAGPG
jgi:5-methylcytosine-specific restriction protein A